MIPTWLFFIYMAYGIPCLILYLLVVFVLIKPSSRNLFKSSFFTIAIVMAIVDISDFLFMMFNFKWRLCPLTGPLMMKLNGSYFDVLAYFFQNYLNLSHAALVTLTALNRMTSMAIPRLHEKLWKKLLWPGIIAALTLSYIPEWHLPFSTVFVVLFNEKTSKDSYVQTADYPGVSTAFNHAIYFFVIAIVGLLLNALCIGFLLKLKSLTTTQSGISQIEIRLVFISLFDFILEILCCVHQISIYVIMMPKDKNWDLFDILFLQIPWLFDVINLSRPFLLLSMSQQVRSSFFNLFRNENVRVIEQTPSAIPHIGNQIKNFMIYPSNSRW